MVRHTEPGAGDFLPAVPPLSTLAADIRSAHADCFAAVNRGLDFARRAGELLIEAKAALPHGEFTAWVERECGIVPRTAQRYVKIARNWPAIEAAKSDRGSLLTITDARDLLTEPAEPTADVEPAKSADIPRETRRKMCGLWWDQLHKWAVMLDVAGWTVERIADWLDMPERDVRLALDPEYPRRFETAEDGGDFPQEARGVYAAYRESYAACWRWSAFSSARYYVQKFGGWPAELAAELAVLERDAERKYRRAADRAMSADRGPLGPALTAVLCVVAGDDCRVAFGIETKPSVPLIPFIADLDRVAERVAAEQNEGAAA